MERNSEAKDELIAKFLFLPTDFSRWHGYAKPLYPPAPGNEPQRFTTTQTTAMNMRIAVYGNCHQERHIGSVRHLFEALAKSKETEVRIEKKFYAYLRSTIPDFPAHETVPDSGFTAEIAFSIGGDGTFLRTAACIGRMETPIIGVNTGHLGYLADVPIEDIDEIVCEIQRGDYQIESRSLLQIDTDADVELPARFALNEVAVLKNDSASMLRMETSVDDTELAAFLGDGLIVATPTGSTAYNLSVGGPILQPNCRNWVLSPIAAHSLTMRPLILPDSSRITVSAQSERTNSFRISVDGASVSLPVGSRVRLQKASFQVKIMQRLDHDFAKTLRNKLMWGADAR